MTIAYVIDSLAVGGAQKHLCQLVRGLAERGHRAVVFCLNPIVAPSYRAALSAAGAELHLPGKARVVSGIALPEMAAVVRRERAALIVTVLFAGTLAGRAVALLTGLPVITCVQARNVNYRRWQFALLRATAARTACFVFNSRAAIPFAVAREGAAAEKCRHVANGVEVPPVPRAKPVRPRAWGAAADETVIGAIGRLDPQKGFDVLLQAFALLRRQGRAVRLILIGGGGEEARLKRRARELSVEPHVHFTGEDPAAAELLPGLDLYVQPSRFEGTPNAVMEAMAAGVPVVASRVDGLVELIEPGRTGWLAEPADAASLAAAMERALADPARAAAVAASGRDEMERKFPVRDMVAAYETIFVEFLGAVKS